MYGFGPGRRTTEVFGKSALDRLDEPPDGFGFRRGLEAQNRGQRLLAALVGDHGVGAPLEPQVRDHQPAVELLGALAQSEGALVAGGRLLPVPDGLPQVAELAELAQ